MEEKIGDRIRKKRIEKGMTLEQLANFLDVGHQAVSKYEKGVVTNIPLERIEALAKALGTTTEYLINGNKTRNFIQNQNELELLTEEQKAQLDSYLQANTIMYFDGHKNTTEDLEEIKQSLTEVFIHILKKQGKLNKK